VIVFFPIRWSPKGSTSLLERYPRSAILTMRPKAPRSGEALLRALYWVISGRAPAEADRGDDFFYEEALRLTLAICERLRGSPASAEIRERIVDLLTPESDPNGLERRFYGPELVFALGAVLRGAESGTMYGQGAYTYALLSELAPLLPGYCDDYDEGEWAELSLPALGVSVFLSREAIDPATGRGCSSCMILELPR
jgi:hypothetical protein